MCGTEGLVVVQVHGAILDALIQVLHLMPNNGRESARGRLNTQKHRDISLLLQVTLYFGADRIPVFAEGAAPPHNSFILDRQIPLLPELPYCRHVLLAEPLPEVRLYTAARVPVEELQ